MTARTGLDPVWNVFPSKVEETPQSYQKLWRITAGMHALLFGEI